MKGFIFIILQVNKNAVLSGQMAGRASPLYHNTEKPIPTVYQLPYSIFALTTTKMALQLLSCYIKRQLEQERH